MFSWYVCVHHFSGVVSILEQQNSHLPLKRLASYQIAKTIVNSNDRLIWFIEKGSLWNAMDSHVLPFLYTWGGKESLPSPGALI